LPILIDQSKNHLLYLHIPKTAGTSLKSNLRDDVTLVLDVEFKSELPCPPQHFHYELLYRLGLVSLCTGSFAIVRHPIDRFISEYTYRKKVDKKFKYLNLTAFFIFCRYVYPNNPYLLANHIRPQCNFVGAETTIFKLENGITETFQKYPSFFQSNMQNELRKNVSNSTIAEIDQHTFDGLINFYKDDLNQLGYLADECKATIISKSKLNYMLSWAMGAGMALLYKLSK
jgi:hypothetical protein